jgi:hypothetical protein
MPDWLTHTMISWMTGKAIKMEVGLVVLGSIIPDIVKINDVITWFGTDLQGFFHPFHTPFVSLLVGGIIALFFANTIKVFFTFGIGITTHFILDFFLIGATKGIQLLFPFSWNYWRFNEILTNYHITIIALFAALGLYMYYHYKSSRKTRNKQDI